MCVATIIFLRYEIELRRRWSLAPVCVLIALMF